MSSPPTTSAASESRDEMSFPHLVPRPPEGRLLDISQNEDAFEGRTAFEGRPVWADMRHGFEAAFDEIGGSRHVHPSVRPSLCAVMPKIFLADWNGLDFPSCWSSPSTRASRASRSISATFIGPGARTIRRSSTASFVMVESDGSAKASSAVSSMCWVPHEMREVSISSPVSGAVIQVFWTRYVNPSGFEPILVLSQMNFT